MASKTKYTGRYLTMTFLDVAELFDTAEPAISSLRRYLDVVIWKY
jgi:hypothetical protein